MSVELKIANYSEAQVARLKAGYQAGETVEALGLEMGKSARSVIAKLTREGVYVSKAKEAGKREMLKAEMVSKIALAVGATEEQVESLEKATGQALMFVLRALEA